MEELTEFSSHQIIEQKYNSLSQSQADLEKHLPKEKATIIIVDIYANTEG
jgi:hypothetical protein